MMGVGFPLLSLLTFLPLAGVAIILAVRGDEKTVATNARWTALWTSLITFMLSLVLWFRFDKNEAEFQFVERLDWLADFGVTVPAGAIFHVKSKRRREVPFKSDCPACLSLSVPVPRLLG